MGENNIFNVPDPRPIVGIYRWISNLFPTDCDLVETIICIFYSNKFYELNQVIDRRFTERDLWDLGIMDYDIDRVIKRDLGRRCCLGNYK
jgi:hypothetical protein